MVNAVDPNIDGRHEYRWHCLSFAKNPGHIRVLDCVASSATSLMIDFRIAQVHRGLVCMGALMLFKAVGAKVKISERDLS